MTVVTPTFSMYSDVLVAYSYLNHQLFSSCLGAPFPQHNATVKSNTVDASSVVPKHIPEESSPKVENGKDSSKKGAVAQATKSPSKGDDYDSWDEEDDD